MSTLTQARPAGELSTIRSVGGILPPDVLAAVASGVLPGLDAADYHLEVSPREAANRAWSVLLGAWASYRDAMAARPEGGPAVALTRERWSLIVMRELGFGRVPVTPAGGIVADGRSWPVSHCADARVPVHLLGWDVPLDRRTRGMPGAADKAPHAMVQELLNVSDQYLWAIVCNGSHLRLLRDSTSLVGPSYVEVDLETIFSTEAFADFVVAWLICHQSRFEPSGPEAAPSSCWLERWREHAAEVGARALGALRTGVHDAVEILGSGFSAHRANAELRSELESGRLSGEDYERALLRLVYRLLFCFVAEDRDLLLSPDAPAEVAARYRDWYSTARLRRMAVRRAGDHHHDLWLALSLVTASLGKEEGCPQLGLPGLGGIFEPGPADLPAGLLISNRDLLAAVRRLCVTRPDPKGPRRVVDYRHLGAEELGGIYESLLEYVPRYDAATRSFSLVPVAGNDRKRSGAYYTPSALTESLLDTALGPLVERAARSADPSAALLALTVCDPACGSGHFLVAAARRIANRLAQVWAEGDEPTLAEHHAALHEVVSRCCYGVDVNPLAAELAKVSLWLEGLQAGAPLGLLDSHIKVGNALLGTTPALLADGLPESAFSPIEGDDRKHAGSLKARNAKQKAGHGDLFSSSGITVDTGALASRAAEIERMSARSLADVHVAARRLRELDTSPEARRARLVADAWCAAFVLPKAPGLPELTQADLVRLGEAEPAGGSPLAEAIEAVAARYRFFHWHLEFPAIFDREGGGFDCVIGNPPWERVKLQEQEWFASRLPSIAEAPNAAARKKLIEALVHERPALHADFLAARRQAEGESHLIRNSGRYPLAGRGDINTYAVFAEHDRNLLSGTGRLGVILPTGIATDATTQYFFKDLVTKRSLVSLYDFENALPLFEGVHRSFKFCLLTLSGVASPVTSASFAFFAHHPDDLQRPGVCFELTPEEITLLNPNTGTCPVFRSRRDAEITLGIYRRHPVLVKKDDPDGNPWGVSFMQGLFNMTTDSGLFRTAQQLEAKGWELDGNTYRRGGEVMLPLYEAKMVHHYDHRWATYDDGDVRDVTEEEHADPDFTVLPRYWAEEGEVNEKLASRWDRDWLIGFRDICRSTDERTLICAAIPRTAIGNKLPLLLPSRSAAILLAAVLASFVVDYVARQKLGGTTMNFFYLEQLSVLGPDICARRCHWSAKWLLQDWFEDRMDELIYTSWDMGPAALALGDDGPPFRWDPGRRAVLRAELDGAMFHLYGIERADVDYILGTFPIVNRNDVKQYGEERTRRLVLDAYDRIATAIETGEPFQSALDPPPGQGPRHPEVGQ